MSTDFNPLAVFPNLKSDLAYKRTSPATTQYNCIAWSVGINTQAWWPNRYGVWPKHLPLENTINNFTEMFQSLGYEECTSRESEQGFEKIALYVLNGEPSHAARQLPDGNWTSKLGKGADIIHSLEGVEGIAYGKVAKIFKRPLQVH